MNYELARDVISAALESEAPLGTDYSGTAERILNDNFVTLCAQRAMVEHFAVEAIRNMHPTARQALRTRVRLTKPATTPKFRIEWAVLHPDQDGGTQLRICAKSFPEGATAHDEIVYFAPRTPDQISQVRFRGEPIPADIAFLYSQFLGVNESWLAEARHQEIYKAEQAQKKQSNIAAGLTIAMTQGTKEL